MFTDQYEPCPEDEEMDDELFGMHEDAACLTPCGDEPYGCTTCPEAGNGRHSDEDMVDWSF